MARCCSRPPSPTNPSPIAWRSRSSARSSSPWRARWSPIAAAAKIKLEPFDGFDPRAFLPGSGPAAAASLDALVIHNRKSAKTHSGIWRDLAVRKRKTEVEAQLGPISVTAKKLGMTAPLTRRTADLIHDIEDGRKPLSWDTLAELAEDAAQGSGRIMKIAFDGQRVIVTGAGHGFGRAISKAFADAGADGLGLRPQRRRSRRDPEAVRQDLRGAHARRVGPRRRHRLRRGSSRRRRPIDVLVNNAGGVRGQVGRPIEEISEQDWHTIFDVNVTGAFYFAQAVAPGMKQEKRGRIINISSRAGLEISLTGIQAYASAKAAQIGLTRQLAHELGPWGITVNNVAPGFVRSNPTTERQWESYGEAGQRKLVESIALKRLGAPEDIAHAVMFFASDYAGWITGQVLSVDGGK